MQAALFLRAPRIAWRGALSATSSKSELNCTFATIAIHNSLPSLPPDAKHLPIVSRPAPTAQAYHHLQHHPIDERAYSHVPYFAGGRVRRGLPSHVSQLQNPGIPAATSTPCRCGVKPSSSSTTLPSRARSAPCYICVRRTQQSICLGLIVASSPVAAAADLRKSRDRNSCCAGGPALHFFSDATIPTSPIPYGSYLLAGWQR